MAEDNLSGSPEPVATTPPPTQESLVEDISNLLEPPETDQPEEHEEATAPTEDDDPLGLAEDVDPDETAEAGDESEEPEIKGGRFAPDSAKVTLDDGTVTTIAELKRGTLFQRDYTKKTQELSEERKSVETERQQVSQYAQQLSEFREFAVWYAEQHLPKDPGPPPDDPLGYFEWSKERDKYVSTVQAYQQLQAQKQAEEQQRNGETQQQAIERDKRETAALLNAIPVLKDPVKGPKVWDNIVAGAGQHYGLTKEDVNGLRNHKAILILRDALELRRIKASAKSVTTEVTKRPVVNNGRRAPANQQARREIQARTERLRKSGNREDGIAALMDFDL